MSPHFVISSSTHTNFATFSLMNFFLLTHFDKTNDCLTIVIHKVIKYGLLRARRAGGQVQRELVVIDDVVLHLAAVLQLQQGTHAPHDHKDVELLKVLRGASSTVLLILGRDETLEESDGLGRGKGRG